MLITIPTTSHLNRVYYELAKIGADCIGADELWPYHPADKEELLALACEMSRFDPRLFDVMVRYFTNHWHELNPLKLRMMYAKMEWPQTIAVVCEFMKEVVPDDEVQSFAGYLTMGIKPAPTQFYFHHLYLPGRRFAQRATEEGVWEFKKWGFLSHERPVIDISMKRSVGSFDTASRQNTLRRLIGEKGEITLKDYLDEVRHSISRQQALNDLKTSGLVRVTGKGRGARWK